MKDGKDQLMDVSTAELTKVAESVGEIANWSDDKKGEFVGMFQDRVKVARYLLVQTAVKLVEVAQRRQFISLKHVRKIDMPYDESRSLMDKNASGNAFGPPGCAPSLVYPHAVGGRLVSDLEDIVEARAKEVLDELPALRTAVQIIDPETAKMIDRKDKLQKQGQEAKDALEEISKPILLHEVDQKMTIGAFRQMVDELDKKRRGLIDKLQDIGKEGSELETTIAKRLYAGLPGLSDAVVDVIKTHMDRSTALDTMSRRVEEQVKFGDSAAAVDLLRVFEKDEKEVSSRVKLQFTEALEKLKLAAKKTKKPSAKVLSR